jgi:hypothetical protein
MSNRSGGGFIASPPPAATAQGARLSPHDLRCGRSMLARISFSGAPPTLRPVDFVGLTARVKTNEVWHRIGGQELLPSAVIASHARKSLSVIEFRQVRRQRVSVFNSCVNSAPQRKVVSPQWDSRTRPAKRQHHRCIGCEKTLLSFLGPSVGFSLRVVSCVGAALGRFELQAVRRSSSTPMHKPIMISGSRRGNEIDLRQQTTRSVRDIIDAPSSASAAFGGLIPPNPGTTKRQF